MTGGRQNALRRRRSSQNKNFHQMETEEEKHSLMRGGEIAPHNLRKIKWVVDTTKQTCSRKWRKNDGRQRPNRRVPSPSGKGRGEVLQSAKTLFCESGRQESFPYEGGKGEKEE